MSLASRPSPASGLSIGQSGGPGTSALIWLTRPAGSVAHRTICTSLVRSSPSGRSSISTQSMMQYRSCSWSVKPEVQRPLLPPIRASSGFVQSAIGINSRIRNRPHQIPVTSPRAATTPAVPSSGPSSGAGRCLMDTNPRALNATNAKGATKVAKKSAASPRRTVSVRQGRSGTRRRAAARLASRSQEQRRARANPR